MDRTGHCPSVTMASERPRRSPGPNPAWEPVSSKPWPISWALPWRRREAIREPQSRLRTRSLQHPGWQPMRSEEHTSELQSLMRISYAVFCLKKKKKQKQIPKHTHRNDILTQQTRLSTEQININN